MGVFSPQSNFFFFYFMTGLNFRPGGRGPSVPVLLREGGVGNLSHRIKGPWAEEVQAHSHPRLLRWTGRTASGRDSCLGELPGDKYPSCCVEGLESTAPRVATVTGFWHPVGGGLRAHGDPFRFHLAPAGAAGHAGIAPSAATRET